MYYAIFRSHYNAATHVVVLPLALLPRAHYRTITACSLLHYYRVLTIALLLTQSHLLCLVSYLHNIYN